ncbi:hypothetical protein BRE01_49830 [Brevibacillus reuszeri]|uniref:Uncharacterized protein n=1 Tax=Brevibacillus reuszeri TaxID=54915 RepID=A0A0K9YN30_9BACL|nr:hypothetical protein [Brevibacillus reuszeri]KNB69575.1 hypothetical protein ADS79_27320 [Brevibacillus reuszeri]MED1856054.1 hypothetical protein [Brevibacillus reuszeri]GED71281.1 hypothetical protein BRE01_49830 [Brevibacillus reuszeri]
MCCKKIVIGMISSVLCMSSIVVSSPVPTVAAASSYQITYKLPPNPEKYLFLNVEMVDILNPQKPAFMRTYVQEDYLVDMDSGGSHFKTFYADNLRFMTSKKGFLWNIYHFIGILPPHYPVNMDWDELDRRIESTQSFSDEGRALREKRAELQMNAHLQPLIDAGYVKWEELDDGMATKEFIAMVLYRMFKEVRPYHGGIDLKDSEDTAVRWAVEVGLPGFNVDQKGYVYPQLPLNLKAGQEIYAQEQPYLRIFQFINLILPGKKTASGWEYYQVKLKPGMAPMLVDDVVRVNGMPMSSFDVWGVERREAEKSPLYQQAKSKIGQYSISRFPQMLAQARIDALKPRAWDWSRDLIHHPRFAKEIAAYRKNKSSKNLNAVYQAVRGYYNLNIRQDSVIVIKSVLENVK